MMKPNGESCKDCVAQKCTPAFTSCSGLTPPASTFLEAMEAWEVVEAGTNTCMNAADQAKWTASGQTNFASDLSDCGHKALGNAGRTAKCIATKGYTAECSTCFGGLVGCTAKNCLGKCMMKPNGESCKDCVAQKCTPAFTSCSGLTPPASTFLEAMEAWEVIEAGTNTCMDAADQAKWTASGQTNF